MTCTLIALPYIARCVQAYDVTVFVNVKYELHQMCIQTCSHYSTVIAMTCEGLLLYIAHAIVEITLHCTLCVQARLLFVDTPFGSNCVEEREPSSTSTVRRVNYLAVIQLQPHIPVWSVDFK